MAQKFDFSPMRVKRFGSILICLEPESAASSSSLKTVTQSFSGGIFERAGDEVPGELDRLGLEVVAEAEVAEHLEERVVARGVADVLEVVVLAARAHAALAARGALVAALVLAEEHVLELDHAGIREQQRRVVARHERRRGTTAWPRARKNSRKPPGARWLASCSVLNAISPRRSCRRSRRGPGPR